MKLRARIATASALAAVLVPVIGRASDDAASGGGVSVIGNFSSTIWAILSFLIVLFIIWKRFLPPIVGAIDLRARQIREGLEAAERAKAEAVVMSKRHREEMELARQQARDVIEKGMADAEKVRERLLAEARVQAEGLAAKARSEIALAKREALRELKQRSVDLSVNLAGRLIRKSLDASDHEQLIQDCIDNFQAGKN